MPGDGKKYTIYSDNPKMNTAPYPDVSLPGYAQGGIVLGDMYMELMDGLPASTQEALTRRAARDQRASEMARQAREEAATEAAQEKKRRKPKGM